MINTLFAITFFLSGYLLCYFLNGRDWKSLHSELRDDNKHLVNEFSIRTGGRFVYKPKAGTPERSPSGIKMSEDFRIFTPSMAEEEEEQRYADMQDNSMPELSAEDVVHLREHGVLG